MKKFLISFMLILASIALFSQTKNIKDLENQRKLALREIENTTLLLNNTKKSTETLLNRINLLSEQMRSRTQVITLLNSELEAINEQEVLIEKNIKDLESDLKIEQDEYAKAVRGIAIKKQNKSKLLFILSGKSFSQSLKRVKYLKDYSAWRSNQAKMILEKHTELKDKKRLLQETKASKEQLLKNRESEQLKLETEEKNHQQEVEEASKKQKELQAIIQQKQLQANNLNNQIQKLIADEVARQEREARRLAQEQERKRRREEVRRREKEESEKPSKRVEIEQSQLKKNEEELLPEKTYVTKENVQLSSNFASNKGRLPMPISGAYKVIGKFGVHQHDRWKVTTNSNGIDIQAKSGAQAKAVFEGEVSRVVAFPGFNTCIILRHGGYYTFYGNIKNVSVKQGQKVSTGQTLGTIFTDSDTNASVLHFQLWKGTNKLNPEPWLRK